MSLFPKTSTSLILRLADRHDAEAWMEFVELYEPPLYRLALTKGLQHADAQDVVQEVLVSVSRNVGGWVPDPDRAPFRTWLYQVARSRIVNWLMRSKSHQFGTGGTTAARLLNEQADPDDNDWALFEEEYRRAVFRKAAECVQETFTEQTWQCFWSTAVDQIAISEAAAKFGMTAGSVYIARSRVMARLREEVERIEAESD